MPLGLVALAEALACSIEKTWKLNSWKLMFLNHLNLRTMTTLKRIYYPYSFYLSTANLSQEWSHICFIFRWIFHVTESLVSAFDKLLLAGDLNFHVNDPSEGNAYQFLDVLSCFNLNALNFNILIHKSNNLLDLIDQIWRKHRFSFISQWLGYLETLCCPVYFRLWKAIEQESSSYVKETEQVMSTKHIKTV